MSVPSNLGAMLVLFALAAPTAAALGEELARAADEPVAFAQETVALTYAELVALAWETPQEEAARERQESAHPEPAHPEPAHHDEAPAEEPAPASDEHAASEPSLFAPVTRLVPVPLTTLGATPRIDLAHLERNVHALSPLAPAAPASAAPASATVQTVSVAAPSAPAPVEVPESATPAALAAAVAVTAAAGAAPAAASVWERFRRLGFLALLYSRIAKERLLDHGGRERLLAAIRERPGLAVADLAETTDTPRNTVTYHLRVLEREGLVSSTRNGRNRLFFAPGSLPQRANADALGTLRHETTLAIARQIGATPGVDQKALCAALDLSPSLAHWHADRLVSSGLVDKRREGRSVRYYPGAAFALVAARSA